MIVRIISGGKSFKGLAAYLTHDPNAETEERVGWTHTLNLANDHVPSAVNEMVWTARDAELLKQEAGIRGGGRATQNTVKHVSLSWAPGEDPTKEHMIETGGGFLRSMGWHEQQTVIVAHTDKAYCHVHLMIGTVHPETGLKLNESFEQRRAQAWALEYEREQGRIHCEQRLKEERDRQDAPTREAWLAFAENQKMFERAETLRQQQAEHAENAPRKSRDFPTEEWQQLKNAQRGDREAYFAAGKTEFSDLRLSIYHEVREEFRGRWGELYAARRAGADADTLTSTRLSLIAEQKDVLAERRDAACLDLRERRDIAYRALLDSQRDARTSFHERLAAGIGPGVIVQERQAEVAPGRGDASAAFRDVAAEVSDRAAAAREPAPDTPATGARSSDAHDADTDRAATQGSSGLGMFGLGLLTFGESLFGTFVASDRVPKKREEREADLFTAAAQQAANRSHQEREAADEDWRKREKEKCRD